MAGEGRRFFGIYFFVAVAGSILIVFGAPFAVLPRDLPAPVARAIRWLDQNPSARKLSASLQAALSWKPPSGAAPLTSRPAAPPAVSAPPPKPPPPPAPESVPAPAPVATGMTETAEAPVGSTPPPESVPPEPPPPPESSLPPELAPAPPPPDTNRWGIIRSQEAKVYSTQGKFLARIAAGAMLDIRDMIEAEAGVFARGSLYGATNNFTDALVATNDLEIRVGAYSTVPAREKELRGAEARLLSELALHRAGGAKYMRKDYPMTAEYLRIRQEYLDYWKKVRALQAQLAGTEGPGRMRIEDSLRMMKGEDVRVGQAYEKAKLEYEQWNQANPEPTGQEKAEVDVIEEELGRIRSELEAPAAAQP